MLWRIIIVIRILVIIIIGYVLTLILFEKIIISVSYIICLLIIINVIIIIIIRFVIKIFIIIIINIIFNISITSVDFIIIKIISILSYIIRLSSHKINIVWGRTHIYINFSIVIKIFSCSVKENIIIFISIHEIIFKIIIMIHLHLHISIKT